MIEKKSLLAAIKRALQTGGFQLIGQELTAFPIEVCRIDTLVFDDQNWWDCNPITKMDLSNNSISELPAEIVKLPDLQLIRLKNNLVKQLPPQLFELQNLKSLDLAKNKLQALPQEIQSYDARRASSERKRDDSTSVAPPTWMFGGADARRQQNRSTTDTA